MSSKYKEFKDINFARIAEEVLEFWQKEEILKSRFPTEKARPLLLSMRVLRPRTELRAFTTLWVAR